MRYTSFTGVAGVFGYDATDTSSPRRSLPAVDLRGEDEILDRLKRDRLVSTARDAKRNWVVAGWMIRKHLDFVSDFTWRANTPDKEWNKAAQDLIQKWGRRHTAHVSRRHPLRRLVRMAETMRVLDGDLLIEKIKPSTSLNLIRGDRIRNRGAADKSQWVSGVRIHQRTQESLEFDVHKRTRGGRFVPDKRIPAANCIHHGYFNDDPECIRGISPMAPALNDLRDTYEAKVYALARLKIEQILGVAITKKAESGVNPFVGNQQFNATIPEGATDEEIAAIEEEAADEESRKGSVDFGKGHWLVELLEGEDIKHIAGNMPSSNAREFLELCIEIVLKALDLPTSFWDESHTNFFGSRGALQLYRRSAQHKQADNAEMLDEITTWRLRKAIIDDELYLPRGWKLDDIESQWVPRGIPWWDRSKEIRGDLLAIGAGIDSVEAVCLDHGTGDPYNNIDKTSALLDYARERGLVLNFDPSPELTVVQQGDNNNG